MASKLTKEEFVSKAQLVHGDKYDYSLVDYVNSQTKVIITCPIHGSFDMKPNSHLSNQQGCPACYNALRGKSRQAKAKSVFIDKANQIHNNKYDYSETVYVKTSAKVIINCPTHGSFLQTPNDHLAGKGCRLCGQLNIGWTRSKFKDLCIKNNNGLGILYILECFNDHEHFFKIGITSRSIQKRYKDKVTMPYAYRVIDEIIGDPEYIYDLETELHNLNKQHHYEPTIPFAGSSIECFSIYKEVN